MTVFKYVQIISYIVCVEKGICLKCFKSFEMKLYICYCYQLYNYFNIHKIEKNI